MSRIEGASRADMFAIDPELVTMPTSGPLFDERTAWPVNENLVANIRFRGQLVPIIVRKNGTTVEVIAGRQRLKAILEINRQAKERGEMPMKIKCTLEKGTDAENYGIMISENEIRRDDDPMTKAAKAKRLLQYGMTAQQIAVTFGVKVRAVDEWLSLTDVAPEVQAAIHAGEIAAGVGVALASLPRDQQAPKLAELQASGQGKPVSVDCARRAVRARPGAVPRPKPRSGREMRSRLDSIFVRPISELTPQERHWAEALEWALGEIEILEAAPSAKAKTPPRPNGQAAEARI